MGSYMQNRSKNEDMIEVKICLLKSELVFELVESGEAKDNRSGTVRQS